jgi:uncharacterized protein (DUF488 family)
MAPEFVTIGVYGFEEAQFFEALVDAGVDLFCDIRQRRGVRGSTYAFANSQRLQARLAELGIGYVHRKDLAPSREVRALQNAADKESKTAKRKRSVLSDSFVEAYRREYLDRFDSEKFVSDLNSEASVVALFCVERDPAACHRSLLAERLESDLGIRVVHIVP